jgi:very-short-patch-repair endonuclease
MAATLVTGGVLSHRSAGALWGLRPSNGRIDVTVAWDKSKRPGLLLHRAVLAADEITIEQGIPVTTPARTQLDLAGVLQRHQLQQAINEAECLRLDGPQTERHPTKKGTAELRTLAPPTHTKRDLEARFTTFLTDRRLPMPQTNVLIEGVEVDAAWPDERLIVELDSWEYHRTRAAFAADRRRDRRLAAAGWRVLRVTWRDLDEPGRLAAELAGFF